MDYNNLLNTAKSNATKSNILSGAGMLAEISGSVINYNALKTQNAYNKVQASQIELQAQQQMNQLREQFNNAVGNYQYNAATRGVKAGGLNSTLEMSAKNLGEDMKIINNNSRFKSDALRTQARINNRMANAQLLSSIGVSIGEFGETIFKNSSRVKELENLLKGK